MTSTAADTFARFVDVLADTMDDHDTDGEALASRCTCHGSTATGSSPPRRVSHPRRCVDASCSSERRTS